MDRQRIVAEIKRLAAENDGRSPGWQAFARATGARKSDWYPDTWLRWSDALAEAGCVPNEFKTKTPDEVLIGKYIELVRELGRLPVHGEVRRKAKNDQAFPNHAAFDRFGGKDTLLKAVAAYCRAVSGFEDVLALCAARENASAPTEAANQSKRPVVTGFVYLMKSGRHYKIGRTNSVGRRGSELAIKIPVPPTTIHSIETDDPVGVEAYWHKRFAEKRGEGEWFDLSPDDVSAFKRWKRIV